MDTTLASTEVGREPGEPFVFWGILLDTGILVLQVIHIVTILLEYFLFCYFYFNEKASRINSPVWMSAAIFLSNMLSICVISISGQCVFSNIHVAFTRNKRLKRPHTLQNMVSTKMVCMTDLWIPNVFISVCLWRLTKEWISLLYVVGVVFLQIFT